MPSKKLRLTVYLSPEEHAAITASASRAGISLSTFAKRVCTGMAVPSLEHRQAVKDMLKANAVQSSEEYVQELMAKGKSYIEKGRKLKVDKK